MSFSSSKVRNIVVEHRRELKKLGDLKVFIGKNLTKIASALFFEARNLVKAKRLNVLDSCWTRDDNVFVKRLELDKPILITIRRLFALHRLRRRMEFQYDTTSIALSLP